MDTGNVQLDADVIGVGAGFAGLYLHHRLRQEGFSVIGLETADDLGGTWYWNRYPGARCDIQSVDYSYSFDPELDAEWEWSEKYATQPEILRYLNRVADKHDLRRDIRFSTRIESATWDDATATWSVSTSSADKGLDRLTCRHLVMATGCLSAPKSPDIAGVDRFEGPVYFTSSWPHDGVDFTGLRVGVVGTGSSGIQSIPIIAEQAAQLTVFQRTPNFSIPAGNGAVPAEKRAAFRSDPAGYREEARWSGIGVPSTPSTEGALMLGVEEQVRRLDEFWRRGELVAFGETFSDWLIDPAANAVMADYVRDRIREIVDDPAVADLLCPTDHPLGTKRPCLDSGYYATFNRPNVRLVDLRATPIGTITEAGLTTAGTDGETFEFDALVLATGFDAMTGAVVNVDLRGRGGRSLADVWSAGPTTYLGLMTAGFPNLYLVTGPGSPSVLSNMVVSIEQHVDWITDALVHLRTSGRSALEPTDTAQDGWVRYVNDWGDLTLYPLANSWYMGANVPGKPRVFLPYVGTVGRYRRICDEVVAAEYLGFVQHADDTTVTDEREVRPIRADVEAYLDALVDAELPPFETLDPEDARALNEQLGAQRPPGPDVGELIDGTLPGPAGPLAYRCYRPTSPGPHPALVYFHGGGWVLGSAVSDDPLCRYLCQETDSIVVSVDYRHAPEVRFPGAVDDAMAALRWVADHADELGADPARLAVGGWSAGGNLAAVCALLARDGGGPALAAQVLITPVTDVDPTRPSRIENATGFGLTSPLMDWFTGHYLGDADRDDWRAAPLRAPDLSGLPPAVVLTCGLDPLRDEGDAYAVALAKAGVEVTHLEAWGQCHLSIPAIGVIVTIEPLRAALAAAARDYLRR